MQLVSGKAPFVAGLVSFVGVCRRMGSAGVRLVADTWATMIVEVALMTKNVSETHDRRVTSGNVANRLEKTDSA